MGKRATKKSGKGARAKRQSKKVVFPNATKVIDGFIARTQQRTSNRIGDLAEQRLPNERLRKEWLCDWDLKNHIPGFPLSTVDDLDRWIVAETENGEEYRHHEDAGFRKLHTYALERVIRGAKVWLKAHGMWTPNHPKLKNSPRRVIPETAPAVEAIVERRYVEAMEIYVADLRDYIAEIMKDQNEKNATQPLLTGEIATVKDLANQLRWRSDRIRAGKEFGDFFNLPDAARCLRGLENLEQTSSSTGKALYASDPWKFLEEWLIAATGTKPTASDDAFLAWPLTRLTEIIESGTGQLSKGSHHIEISGPHPQSVEQTKSETTVVVNDGEVKTPGHGNDSGNSHLEASKPLLSDAELAAFGSSVSSRTTFVVVQFLRNHRRPVFITDLPSGCWRSGGVPCGDGSVKKAVERWKVQIAKVFNSFHLILRSSGNGTVVLIRRPS